MENKKPLTLLTIFTICLALITGGLTFAWFLLSPEGNGNKDELIGGTTNIYGNIKFEGLETFESDKIYPGVTRVQSFKISKGSKSGEGIYGIILTGSVHSAFKKDIEVKVYKSTDSEKYVDSNGNVVGELTPIFEGVLKNGSQLLDEVEYDTETLEDTTYYVVYHYIYRDDVDQSAAMGKGFSGKIGIKINDPYPITECNFAGDLEVGTEYVNGQYTYDICRNLIQDLMPNYGCIMKIG